MGQGRKKYKQYQDLHFLAGNLVGWDRCTTTGLPWSVLTGVLHSDVRGREPIKTKSPIEGMCDQHLKKKNYKKYKQN